MGMPGKIGGARMENLAHIEVRGARQRTLDEFGRQIHVAPVITSYSIHYTKLYERNAPDEV